ncbi:MAG: N-acetylmuramoyl-L-alanine amidase [Saprospiraceae bacterium]
MKLARFALLLLPFLLHSSFQKVGDKPAVGNKKKPAQTELPATNELPKLPDSLIWLEAEAKKGDNLPALLKRFDLYEFECNTRKFAEINKYKDGAKISPGKRYKLPVLVLKYNGKSIRTTLKTSDLQLAIRIEAYNKNALRLKLRDDNFIQSKSLWVPYHEFGCPAEGEEKAAENELASRPAVAIGEEKSYLGDRVFPIFGPKYQKTPLESQKLRGKVFYIISGHGGPDVGAQGKRAGHTLCEDEYAYDVSLRLLRLLIAHGATAYMIVRDPDDGIRDEECLRCDKDEKVWGNRTIPLGQKARLFQRTDLVNELTKKHLAKGVKDQTLIEIHVDSRSRHHRTDVFFYYRNGSASSEKLARNFHNTFKQKYLKVRAQRNYSGTVSTRDLHSLRETTVPTAVYIELGNIRNDHDQQRLVLVKNRQALAKWLFEGMRNEG